MRRLTPLLALAIALSATTPATRGASADPPNPTRPPNVLLFLADDLRADALGAYGNPHVRTPHLNALARSGTTFRRAYVMGSHHGAVCVPSRAMLLTGRSLFRLGGNGNVIPPQHPTFPQLLRAAGYVTFATGKWHNDRASFARSFSDGGHLFFGGMSSHTAMPVHPFDASGRYPGKGEPDPGGKFSSELFADDAIEFLRGRKDDDRPFYLHLAFTAPHDPRQTPPGYEGSYNPAKLPLPANFLPQHPFDNGEMNVRDELLATLPRDEGWVRRELAAYYAMITHMDGQIGRVLAALRETGKADDTLIVFAADNGLALGSHGLLGKQNLYEHSARVPLILSGPSVAAGRTSDALCYLLDLFPTLCDLTGVAAPQNDGRTLLPILRGERDAPRDGLLLAYRDVQRAYRDDRFKLIEYRVNGAHRTQLFDLRHDPSETKDLSADLAHAETLGALRRKLREAQAREGDPQAAPAQ